MCSCLTSVLVNIMFEFMHLVCVVSFILIGYRLEFLKLSSLDILDGIILCYGALQCIEGCLSASFISSPLDAGSIPPFVRT